MISNYLGVEYYKIVELLFMKPIEMSITRLTNIIYCIVIIYEKYYRIYSKE